MISAGVCFIVDSGSSMLMNTMLSVLDKHWGEFELPIKQNIINELKDNFSKTGNDLIGNFLKRKVC
jgi:hypothetical protein